MGWSKMIEAKDYLKIRVDTKFIAIPLPTNEDISNWEQNTGIILPESFKQILKLYSGKTPVNIEITRNDGLKLGLCCLYHVYSEMIEHQSYLLDTESMESLGFGSDLLEFSSSENYFFCFDLSKNKKDPAVILIDSSCEPDDPDHRYKLANNFDEFLEKYTVPIGQVNS